MPRTSYESMEGAPDERVQMDMTDLDVAGVDTGLLVAASVVVMTNNPYAISTNASVLQLTTSIYSGSTDLDGMRRTQRRRLARALNAESLTLEADSPEFKQHKGGLFVRKVAHRELLDLKQKRNARNRRRLSSSDDENVTLTWPPSDIATTVVLQNQDPITYNGIPVSYLAVVCRREGFVSN